MAAIGCNGSMGSIEEEMKRALEANSRNYREVQQNSSSSHCPPSVE
jgi:hypothetical protein